MAQFKGALNVALPKAHDDLTIKLRDWAKKVNADDDIRNLQHSLLSGKGELGAIPSKTTKGQAPRILFISVTSRSGVGAQTEVWFQNLAFDELDWDEATRLLASQSGNPT